MNKYDPKIWFSISNRYRLIARLPEGKTGLEALKERAPESFEHIMQHAEQLAADEYRRTYARQHGDEVELSSEDYSAFRKAGGRSSW